MRFGPTLGPARPSPSPLTLATLVLVWAVAFGLLVAGYAGASFDAAHWQEPMSNGAASAGSPGGLGVALTYIGVVGITVAGTALLLPFFGLTWLALPPRERRTFPAVAALWAGAVAAAFAAPALPPTLASAVSILAVVTPVLITGEVLRSVVTASIHALGAEPTGSARDV